MQQGPSFKERVKNEIIRCAKIYKNSFVDYEYILFSDAFHLKDFYIIDAKEDNYQHLTGVNSLLSPKEFFEKAYNGTLEESDFDFNKDKKGQASVKGSVRRKINVLPNIGYIFNQNTLVEENLQKNQVKCSFATSDMQCTLGFIDSIKSRPMTLLSGVELNNANAKFIKLLLRKHISKDKFDELIIGNIETLNYYRNSLEEMLDNNIISRLDTLISGNKKVLMNFVEKQIEKVTQEKNA